MTGRVVAIMQARMSSSRLPGKVLHPLCGRPMFLRQIERLRRCKMIDEIIVATSTGPEDGAIADACISEGIPCFRGSLTDVLDRYHEAAAFAGNPTHVVRLTADCPLADPEVIDACIDLHLRSAADYTSNTIERHFPKGLDVEVMTANALETAWREGTSAYDREHVTPYLYGHPEQFRLETLKADFDRGDWRWTVDTAADMEVVEAVYQALYETNPAFDTDDVIAFLKRNAEIAGLNGALG